MCKLKWDLIINNVKESEIINPEDKVSIACVLAYFNGAQYIKDQIQSIISQKLINSNLTIFISDDNSEEEFPNLDDLAIHNRFQLKIYYRKLHKNIGYAKNFLFSLRSIGSEFDYYCFSDQDDIWLNNKIEHSINRISAFSIGNPILYCGRTIYFDMNCKKKLGYSIDFKKKPSFRNAILQNIAGGNTMLFNKEARNLIVTSLKNNNEILSHDWWTYIIITGAGGAVYYDNKCFVKYRQHNNNLQGSNNSLKDRLYRIMGLFNGKYRAWNNLNIDSLKINEYLLSNDNKEVLQKFTKMRNRSFFKRIYLAKNLFVYRQTFFGNIALIIAIIFKRI